MLPNAYVSDMSIMEHLDGNNYRRCSKSNMSIMEHLDGNNYERCTERMLFCSTYIEVVYMLFMNPSSAEFARAAKVNDLTEIKIINPSKQTARKDDVIQDPKRNYKKNNLTCRGMLLHYMSNVLFEIY